MKSISDWILTHTAMWKKFDAKRFLEVTHTKEEVKGSTEAIIFFPYWTGKSHIYKRIAKHFPQATKIYFDYPNEVISANTETSIGYIKKILYDANIIIRNLRRKGNKKIILVGSSFGSNIALKLATMTPVEKIVLNMIDKNYATSIMESKAMKKLRKEYLKKGITLKKLQKIYDFISTDTQIKNIKNKKNIQIQILTSNTDIYCTTKEFEEEIQEIKKQNIQYEHKTNKILGHILSIYYNTYISKKIIKFIRKE